MSEDINVKRAKQLLKSHIKFMNIIFNELSGKDLDKKARGIMAVICISEYMNKHFLNDVEKNMKDYGDSKIN